MHAVEGGAVSRRKQPGDRLVRGDHELLDEGMCLRLSFAARVSDAAAAVEVENDLRCLDPQRSTREAAAAKLARPLVEAAQDVSVPERLGAGEDPLCLAVRQPRVAADDRAVERRLARC